MDIDLLKNSLACTCPKCKTGALFTPGLSLTLNESCPNCTLPLYKNDSADGPAVFLIFILGALLVPLALWLNHIIAIPLWAHAILWTIITLALTLGALKPIKSYIIALQYKHRPWT